MLISIGIFAHNEERDIGSLISDLAKQNLLSNETLSIAIHVVANGCTDSTVSVSKTAFSGRSISTEKYHNLCPRSAATGKIQCLE